MRYAVVKTQKKDFDVKGGPIHWLRRGTLVRILKDNHELGLKVESMYPVFGVPVYELYDVKYVVRQQHVSADDLIELPGQLGPMLESWAEHFQRVREWLCLA